MKWFCAVYDRLQGKVCMTVNANTEDEADEMAMIAAAELGCVHVTDVICSLDEDDV